MKRRLFWTIAAMMAMLSAGSSLMGYWCGKKMSNSWWQAQQKEYGIVPKIEFVPNPHLSSVCRVEWKSRITGKTGHGKWVSCLAAQSWLHSDPAIEMTIVEKPEPKDAK